MDSNSTVTVDDSSSIFNPSYETSEFHTTYSYAATTEQYRLTDTGGVYADWSGMSSLVSGTLDSDYVYITGLPTSTVSVQLGASWSDTAVFANETHNSSATFTYSETYSPDSVLKSVSISNNKLTFTANADGTARIVVYAIDGSGKGAWNEMYVTVPLPYDTITVTLDDQSGKGVAAGTRYYCRLFSGSDTSATTPYNSGVTGLIPSGGSFQVYFQQGDTLFARHG